MNTDNEKKYLPIDHAFADFILRQSGIAQEETLTRIFADLSLTVRSGGSCLKTDSKTQETLLSRCGRTVSSVNQENFRSFPLILDGDNLYFQKLVCKVHKLFQHYQFLHNKQQHYTMLKELYMLLILMKQLFQNMELHLQICL